MMERIVRHLSYLTLLSRVEFRDYNVLQDVSSRVMTFSFSR